MATTTIEVDAAASHPKHARLERFVEEAAQVCKPAGNERCHPRIPSRNAQACIKTQLASIVVKVTNVSRKGLCFRSTEKLWKGTEVSVATYYIEGGQNIFQKGKIVRVRRSPSGILTEYGVEFLS